MDFRHMSGKEIASHIEKFGTDEQKLLVEKLWSDPDDPEYYIECPLCDEREEKVQRLCLEVGEVLAKYEY